LDDLILHHYPTSPFSEKLRLIFGFKQLAWRSVHIPQILPKPDVIALTGGYRKTPIVQVGADVYCDTALIARLIEARQPTPTLYPAAAAGTAQLLAQWADTTLFWTIIPYTLQPAGLPSLFGNAPPEMVKAFAADRAPFSAGMVRQTPADATASLHAYLGWLETHLADGHDYLVGGEPSIADFSVGHCLWFVKRAPELARIVDGYPKVAAWHARVQAFGHGDAIPMTSTEALAVAAAATGHAPVRIDTGLGFEAGDAVTVMPIDTGRDPSPGSLVGLTNDEVVIRRVDERAGILHVHFPRIGFQIKKEKGA